MCNIYNAVAVVVEVVYCAHMNKLQLYKQINTIMERLEQLKKDLKDRAEYVTLLKETTVECLREEIDDEAELVSQCASDAGNISYDLKIIRDKFSWGNNKNVYRDSHKPQ